MRRRLTPFRTSQTPRGAELATAFMALYALTALIAYRWTSMPGGLAVFWVDNGLLAAALLLLRPRYGLAVAAFCFLADLFGARFLGDGDWGHATMIAALDFAEAWTAAVLIRRAGGAGLDLT
jgi:integral membrane sensor domain MASE1